MNDKIDLTYFAYGNRDFPCIKKDIPLSNASVCVKTSSADLLQRNYLNFDRELINSYKPKNLRKIIHSKSNISINPDENMYNKYHPEYKIYKNTKEQISELNNYINPISQFLYKDKPQIKTSVRLLPMQKYKQEFYNNINNKRYNNSETEKEKIILKNYKNNSILIPNNFKMTNNNPSFNVRRFEGLKKNRSAEELKLGSFLESKQSPDYLRNYDKEAFTNIDNYYINKKENLHVLSRFGNWITLNPNDKNRSHALEKRKHGIYETSLVAPIWMDIASRRKINKNYEPSKKIFKSIQFKNYIRGKAKVTFLVDRNQNNAKPLFMRDTYEKNRILLQQKNHKNY
jgi:hypothetical protein